MAKHRRRRGLHGLLDLDLGTPLRNVGLGAGLNVGGSIIGPKIPVVGDFLTKIPGGPGLGLGLLAAAVAWFRGKKGPAMQIATGAIAVSALPLAEQFGLTKLGLISASYNYQGLGAIVPTVRMGDGTMRQLTDGEYGGPSVTQGLGMHPLEVMQGGILQ